MTHPFRIDKFSIENRSSNLAIMKENRKITFIFFYHHLFNSKVIFNRR
jgi:hypothetical protein